ncbi:MAG: glycoside hydrolase family 2 TIM barrel-domain containing protein [Clostridia bacterium]
MNKYVSLNKGWKHKVFNIFQNGSYDLFYMDDYDDSDWRVVDVPHDSSIEQEFKETNLSGPRGGYATTTVCFYNRYFNLTAQEATKHITVEFEGVYMNATTYINGEKLGKYPYGYTAVTYDISDYVKEGENKISVFVDNEKQPGSRWYSGTGIYRPVTMHISEKVHLDKYDFVVKSTQTNDNEATVEVDVKLFNKFKDSVPYTLTFDFYNEKSELIESKDLFASIGNNCTADKAYKTVIKNPELWCFENPALYTCNVTLKYRDGTVCDEMSTKFGIRTIEFSPETGFYINGKHDKLKGLCIHHDNGCIGACADPKVIRKKLELVKTTGANAVRTVHNPESTEFLNICDELGLYVMAEAFDEWIISKRPRVFGDLNYRQRILAYSEYYEDWAEKDLSAMVRRDRNHPSIILWSIGNEILELRQKEGEIMTQQLVNIVKEHDKTRHVTVACNGLEAINKTQCPDIVDVCGYNYANAFYDGDHAKHPYRPILGSENPSMHLIANRGDYEEFLTIQDSYDTSAAKIDPTTVMGDRATIRSSVERTLISFKDHRKEFVAGQFTWAAFDYMGEAGPDTWPTIGSPSGVFDRALLPKDNLYFYQSVWTDNPIIHIMPHWSFGDDKVGKKIPVVCLTNCDEVEIFVNGTSFGTKVMNKEEELFLEWDNVIFEKGEIKAVGLKDGQTYTDVVNTVGKPASIEIELDTYKADVGELIYSTAKIVDENGAVVPTANMTIKFASSEDIKFVGSDNGNTTYSKFMSSELDTSAGMAICVFAGKKPTKGTISVSFECDGKEITATADIEIK